MDNDENSIPVSGGVGLSRSTRSRGLRDHNYSIPKHSDGGFTSSFAESLENIDNVEHSVSVTVSEQQTCETSLQTNLSSVDVMLSNSSVNFHLDNVFIEQTKQTSSDEREVFSGESSAEMKSVKQVESSGQPGLKEAIVPNSQQEQLNMDQSVASDSAESCVKQDETLEREVNSSTSDGINLCSDNAFDEDASSNNRIESSVSGDNNPQEVGVDVVRDALESHEVESAMSCDEEVSFKSIKTPDSTFVSCDLNASQLDEVNSSFVSLPTDQMRDESVGIDGPQLSPNHSEDKRESSPIPVDFHLAPLPHEGHSEAVPSDQQESITPSPLQTVISETPTAKLQEDFELMSVEPSDLIRQGEKDGYDVVKGKESDKTDTDGHSAESHTSYDQVETEKASDVSDQASQQDADSEITKNEKTSDVSGQSIESQQDADPEATKIEVDIKFQQLLNQCIKAFELCLSRFPQHYKSAYRLADIYFRSSQFKVNFPNL